MLEFWKDIPGYVGSYQASDQGRVRSVDRVDCGGHRRKSIIRKPGLHNRGYFTMPLSKGSVSRTYSVHSLIMLTFVGPRPVGLEIAHSNGCPSDNRLSNLRYCTRTQNYWDSEKHGTRPIHEKHGRAKLTLKQVRNIHSRYIAGELIGDLAREHGVSYSVVGQIVKGKTWGMDNVYVPLKKKLPKADAAEVTALYESGVTQKQIADDRGVHFTAVSRMIKYHRQGLYP